MNYCIVLFCLLLICWMSLKLPKGIWIIAPPSDRPDDIQFYACHDYSNSDNLGNHQL